MSATLEKIESLIDITYQNLTDHYRQKVDALRKEKKAPVYTALKELGLINISFHPSFVRYLTTHGESSRTELQLPPESDFPEEID